MKSKIIWLALSCGVVLSLVLASCAPKPPAEVAPKEAVPAQAAPKEVTAAPKAVVVPEGSVLWRGTKRDGTVVEKVLKKPTYGGTVVIAQDGPPVGFDEASIARSSADWNRMTNEVLFYDNWATGPVGTGEWTGAKRNPVVSDIGPNMHYFVGGLATGWEFPKPDMLVLHFRPGVHFALDPNSEASKLVNGREFTTEDAVANYVRNWQTSYLGKSYPHLKNLKNAAESVYVSPTNKWDVVIETAPTVGDAVNAFRAAVDFQAMAPREVIAKYGSINDWRNVVGTGPFMLRDYVSGSSATWVRNPNYWYNDPLFPENQLPYVDTVRALIIPDLSTRLTALRTGKIDILTEVQLEMAKGLQATNPELKSVKALGAAVAMRLRNDLKPFSDIRVRRALNMAIDNQEIARDFYSGDAEILTFPTSPDYESHVPLAQMPESVKELYGYYPEKAKQLLADAGYPNGFKTSVVSEAADSDMLQIISGYWKKNLNVDLRIDIKDRASFTSLGTNRGYEIYMSATHITMPSVFMVQERPGTDRVTNFSNLTEQWVEDYFSRLMENFFDAPKSIQLQREYNVKAAEQAWYVVPPVPYIYNFWQPWLNSYEGVRAIGKFGGVFSVARHFWVDQDLKKALRK